MKNIYVQAIAELIATGREVDFVLSRSKTVMEKRGHGRLYLEVLKGVVQELEKQSATNTTKIIVANQKDASSAEVAKALSLIDCAKEKPAVKVDETIIGGVIAVKGHTHIDMSYKDALRKLYQAITI